MIMKVNITFTFSSLEKPSREYKTLFKRDQAQHLKLFFLKKLLYKEDTSCKTQWWSEVCIRRTVVTNVMAIPGILFELES